MSMDQTTSTHSCSGEYITSGRKASGYVIESCDGSRAFNLPGIIECNEIPQNRSEIPSPEVAAYFQHLRDIADYIPTIDPGTSMELLIGRDLIETHVVLDQRLGVPLGQRLPLGWVLIELVSRNSLFTDHCYRQ